MSNQNHPIRVFHLIDTLEIGGAEILLKDIVEASPQSLDHTVFYRKGDGTLGSELRNVGASVVDLSYRTQYDPMGITRFARQCREASVIHTHLPASMVSGRLAGALSSTPVISTHHNLPTNYGFPSRFLERATRPLDTETVAVSNGVLSAFHTSDQEKWSVVHNGVNVEEFHSRVFFPERESLMIPNSATAGPTFLSVGRCVEQKAQQDMITAMNTVVEQNPNATLLIVGTGPRLEELRQLVEEQGLSNNVFLPGFVDSIEPYYRVADCFVSSSFIEGLPITLLEAMAAELPIVATDIPGVNECVVDGWNGFLVPPASPDELGSRMTEMLDSSFREKFSTNAFEFVKEEFSIERTVEKYQSIYQQSISSSEIDRA